MIKPCVAMTVYRRFQAHFRRSKITLECVPYRVVYAQLIK